MLKRSNLFAAADHNAPRRPVRAGWPLVGALPPMLRQPTAFLHAARRQYGDLYTLNLGPLQPIIVNHPDHVQHVLRDNVRNYRKGGKVWEIVRDLLGNGLAVSEGDYWLRQRRMLQPQFHRQRLAALTTLMTEAIDEGLHDWVAFHGASFDLEKAFSAITLKVITKTMFGSHLSQTDIDQVTQAIPVIGRYIISGVVTRALPPWLPIRSGERFRQACQAIDKVLYAVIARGRQALADGRYEDNLLAMLLNVVDEQSGERMTDQQVHDEAITIFMAGYDTTGLGLTWALHLLLQHPEIMARLQLEIDQVLAGRTPTFADLPQLPYTRMVFQEALRLYPPVAWLPRTAVADDVIDGFIIPAGATVIIPIFVIQQHPAFWPDAATFRPERFAAVGAAGTPNEQHPFAWLPLGAGPRLCIGRDFALMEGQLVLAMALQRFRFTAVAERPVTPKLTMALAPKDGVWVQAVERDQSQPVASKARVSATATCQSANSSSSGR